MNRREFLKISGLMPFVKWRKANGLLNGSEPNVIVIVLDAFSGRHLSFNGYPRMTTPNLARLRERSTVYHNHYAGGNYTTPGTASLLTGAYPWTNRAMHTYDPVIALFEEVNLFALFEGHHRIAYTHNGVVDVYLRQFNHSIEAYLEHLALYLGSDNWLLSLLPEDYDTASISWGQNALFDDRGYAGSLFWSQLFSAMAGRQREQLIESYGELFPRCLPDTDAENFFILEQAIDWIKAELKDPPEPFLSYFHLLPPHGPFCPRHDFIGAFDSDGFVPVDKPYGIFSKGAKAKWVNQQRDFYDEFILYTDSEMGRLLDFLNNEGLMENTWLVITSDHGENFERGFVGHNGPTVYEGLIRIPLIVHAPGQMVGRDVYQPTSATDVLPSLLQTFGKDIPKEIDGEDIFESTLDGRSVYCMNSNARLSNQRNQMTKGTVAMVKGRYKLIYYFGYKQLDGGEMVEFYDLENDPEELVNFYEPGNASARDMLEELKSRLATAEKGYW